MGFSKTVTCDYASLEKASGNFLSPSFEINVDNEALKPEDYPVTSVEVNIPVTAGSDKKTIESGQCTFIIAGLFDAKSSRLKIDPCKLFEPGKPVIVKMGYVKRTTVFCGFICQISIQYEAGGPMVKVSALDASYILRNAYGSHTFTEKAPTRAVNDILKQSVVSGVTQIKELNAVSSMNVRLTQVRMDDCALLTLLARRNGYTFAYIHGDILFCDLLTSSKGAIIKLNWGESLMSFQKELNTNRQVGKVVVFGKKPGGGNIKGEASTVTVNGEGKTAAQMDSHISAMTYELNESVLNDQSALDKLAQVTLNDIAVRFVTGKGSCIGLPELIPGRFIKLGGMGPGMDGEYFLTRVVHRIDANGFLTTFEVKGAKS